MKLYYAPGFSSLASHISLLEAGFDFEGVAVDLETKRTAAGTDFVAINPKGYIPAVVFENGEVLTENVAILTWIADRNPALAPAVPMGRYRLIEMLAFIATEIHKRFPIYLSVPEAAQATLRDDICRWFEHVARGMKGDYLFGDAFTTADAYLFVMARGAAAMEFALPAAITGFIARIDARPRVQEALRPES